ncbi:cysteine-rich KTR domain-containing protein [Lachnospiraceae bacterium 38-14]|nr:cysteine-rich KTR domain-containing protein [Roseburia sp. 1XD42-69]RKJ60686.1 hypothetical protein D7Y06_22920 [Roseburia sp. 1XD42-69]
MEKIISEWIHCPVCKNKTRLQIRADTELINSATNSLGYNR